MGYYQLGEMVVDYVMTGEGMFLVKIGSVGF